MTVRNPEESRSLMKKLSEKSQQVLDDICRGRGSHYNCRGRAEHGGRVILLVNLIKRGLIDKSYAPTAAGKVVNLEYRKVSHARRSI